MAIQKTNASSRIWLGANKGTFPITSWKGTAVVSGADEDIHPTRGDGFMGGDVMKSTTQKEQYYNSRVLKRV